MIHTVHFRTFLEDTDAGGIVYHARHLQFMERARTLMFEDLDLCHAQLIEAQTGNFVVTNLNIAYKKPLKLADTLQVETYIEEINGASLILKQTIFKVAFAVSEGVMQGAQLSLKDIASVASVKLAFVCPKKSIPLRLPNAITSLLTS